MGNEIDLGISLYGLDNREFVQQLEASIDDLVQANLNPHQTLEKSIAATYDIQRRGQHYPGDTNSFSPWGSLDRGVSFGLNPGMDRDPGNLISNAFGLGGIDSINIFTGTGSLAHLGSKYSRVAKTKMGLCVQAYKGFGVAKNVIDLMSNFAAEGLKIQHPRPAIQRFYQRWAELVDLAGRVKDILRYYYKYGNVFIYTTMGTIDAETYATMKNAKASAVQVARAVTDNNDPTKEEKQAQVDREKAKPESERQIPWRYTLLNPFQMDVIGDKFFGQSRWVFILDEETQKNMRKPKAEAIDFLDDTEVNLPPEFKELLDSNRDGGDDRIVNLKPENLWTMHYMKDDHEDWADPMLWPVMGDINYKNKLRQSDISVCNSIIKAITLFKIGDYKAGFIPGPEYMRKFSELLRTPSEAMTLIWNDAISIDHSYPPVEKLLSIDKYEAVDRDILRGLGVPDILLGAGGGGNYSNGFLGVRTLLERLEEGRREVEKWVNKQLRMVAEIMGHRDIPKIKFGRMSLRDENAEKQLILGLLDRNIISVEAVLEVFGEDFELELSRLRREEEIREEEGLLTKHGPFVDPLSDVTESEQLDREDEHLETQNQMQKDQMTLQMKQQMQMKKMDMQVKKQDLAAKRKMLKQGSKNTKKINGRPAGTKGIPQTKKRDTKPKGMAFLQYEETKGQAAKLYTAVENLITAAVLEANGKQYKKSLAKEDRTGIEELSFAVSSWLPVDEEPTIDSVKNVMSQDTLVVASDVAEAEQTLSAHFISKNNRALTAEERRDIRAQAIALAYLDSEEEDDSN
jgi:hypothetical protein